VQQFELSCDTQMIEIYHEKRKTRIIRTHLKKLFLKQMNQNVTYKFRLFRVGLIVK
jgi:hypothetical protein